MQNKKKSNSIYIDIDQKSELDFDCNDQDFSDSLSRYKLKFEMIGRLHDSDFWLEFKKHFQVKNLDHFFSDCLEHVQAWGKALQGEVDRSIQKDFGKLSIRDLNKLKRKIEPRIKKSGRLRFLLHTQEERMEGMLLSIDKKLSELGEEPKDLIFPIKPKEFPEDITCPFCGYENKDYNYTMPCKGYQELLGNPWKELTICPECKRLVNRSDIFANKEAFELDSETNLITCDCGTRFDWKQYRREPRTFTIKYCIACDHPYKPDKRNWKKQRICPDCKAKGVDTFYLDHPNYQNKYKKKKK